MKKVISKLFPLMIVLVLTVSLIPPTYLNAQPVPSCDVVLTELHEQYLDYDFINISAQNLDLTTYPDLRSILFVECPGIPIQYVNFKIFYSSFNLPEYFDLKVGTNTLTLIVFNDENGNLSYEEATDTLICQNIEIVEVTTTFSSGMTIVPGTNSIDTVFTLDATNYAATVYRNKAYQLEIFTMPGVVPLISFTGQIDSTSWTKDITHLLPSGSYRAVYSIIIFNDFGSDVIAGIIEQAQSDFTVSSSQGTPIVSEDNITEEKKPRVYEKTPSGFITYFYNKILFREPEEYGLNAWLERLESVAITGADMIFGFIFGEECQNIIKDYSNDKFIEFLYSQILGRDPDDFGYNTWLSKLNSGMSREDMLKEFLQSEEFKNICNGFGVNP